TGLRFAPGAVLLQGIPIAACWPGHALNRRSTRPGCDWGWLGVLAGLRFAPGRCSYRKPAHGEPRCLSGLVGEWEVNLDGEAAEGAFLELEVAVVYLDQVADDIQPEAVPGDCLIQADPALQYPLPIGFADSRAIILDTQQYPLLGHPPLQPDTAMRPFAGVVQQVAEQLEHVLALEWPGRLTLQIRVLDTHPFAMGLLHRGTQPGQVLRYAETSGQLPLRRQPCALQSALELTADLLDLLLQDLPVAGLQHLFAEQPFHHRQRGLQTVAEIADTLARALDDALQLRSEMVDFLYQRQQFLRNLIGQLQTLAGLPLGQFLPGPAQRPQCLAQQQLLHREADQHRQPAQPPEPDTGTRKGLEQWLIIQ